MYRSLFVLTLAVSQLFPANVPLPTDTQLFAVFSSYLESLRTQAGIPGLAAAVIGPNDIVWEGAFGQQDIERLLPAKPFTPFHLDGLTQVFTAAIVLRCVEEGTLSLDDRVGQFAANSPEANSTVRQILSHTSGPPDGVAFAYTPGRVASLSPAIDTCTHRSFRAALADTLHRFAMNDSVPGADAASLPPPFEGIPAAWIDRYKSVLPGLATPYAVGKPGQASPSRYTVTGLTPAAGLISTVRDYARFDTALRNGAILRPDTLAAAWRAPLDRNRQRTPHGLGWFVQAYNGETIVWQFGVSDSASSSLVLTVPGREHTVILLANSDGLVKSFPLASGDLTVSPFGRLLLGLFFR